MRPNEYRIEGDTAFIKLERRDGSSLETMISVSDLDRVINSGLRWSASWHKDTQSFRAHSITKVNGRRTTIQLSRFILGTPAHLEADHINHNTLDNRRENLRSVTRSQNEQNAHGARKDSSTGVRGVFWDKRRRNYRARIWLNGKGIHIGCFATLAEAEAAVRKAREKYFTHSPESKKGCA